MRLLLTLFLCFAAVVASQAQERVRNVRIRAADSSQLEIRYDLINARPGDSVYFEVRSRLRGSLRILPEFVRGDIGTGITAGSDRRIIWSALANGYSLNEEIQAKVLVKTGLPSSTTTQPTPTEPTVVQKPTVTSPTVTTPETVPPKPARSEPVAVTQPKPSAPAAEPAVVPKPTPPPRKPKRGKPSVFVADTLQPQPTAPVVAAPAPQPTPTRVEPMVQSTQPSSATVIAPADTVRHRRTRYAGPAWALLSAVAPGIGNIFVQMPKPKVGIRPLLTVACYGAVVYGLLERQKSQDDYGVYEQQKNSIAGEPYYQTANDHYHRYFLATRGAMVVAAADVILTFIRGIRNGQIQKEARRYQGVMVRPGLQAGQPTAVVRYSF